MVSQEKNKIILNQEIFGTLCLIKNGALGKFTKLMNKEQISQSLIDNKFQNEPMPFVFMFAPNDEISQETIKNAKKNEKIPLYLGKKIVGEIICETVFETKEFDDVVSIFDISNPKKMTNKIHSKLALSGEFNIFEDKLANSLKNINNLKNTLNAQKITALFLTADPLHRVHERLIRLTIDKADFVIIFLIRSQKTDKLPYELRQKTLEYFVKTFLPTNRISIVPLHNTHIFTEHKFPELECIVARNFGANKLVLGQNHEHIGAFFDSNKIHTILDSYKNSFDMEILVMPEFVYCNECKTLVSTKSCPHGPHHHTKYHTQTLKALLRQGIMPPSIFMRKEISAMILSELFPNRFENLQKIYNDLFPNNGILEAHDEKEFYEELMNLYQTSSLK
ncbi:MULTISPECIES: sulfate adenylyltransferase [unclassified Campylobacter]|uniref:sulfate adenylyltransferase n=1 Tax=unclassified Campylobacter TaxID=2593542 RepID=UPI0022E9C0A9|nr:MULTISPECIES: sulfate adenylyltransferase [unclassified Campylobacter]MDA3055625.1 sulfate adenylyltransferase [Campylobacter sp. CN_NA1]MDA3064685.1 sulfate adenylyltransferase [Campylobacter sp. CN_NE4]MDA3068491.1 sulfate adenylyltransferase [Campylobacter sp. CN_NE3]MDA3082196.1 sulfate adenylyltransferase [Campylobacter sp. CN_EL2]MDA3083831.1 sulfate adenylyltransferase [Campylobacter sp. CN_NE1]